MRKVIFRTALLVFLLVALISLSWLSQLSIQKVAVAGISSGSAASVEQGVKSILDDAYLNILPKKNFLFYPKQEIAEHIMSEYPEIGSVNIGTENIHTLNVRLTERTPVALWCKAEACYMVDKNAYAYAVGTSSSSAVYAKEAGLVAIYDTSTTTGSLIGNQAMSADAFLEILSVAESLSSSSLPVEKISIEEGGKYVFKIVKNGSIIFSSRKPLQKSLEDLVSALHSPVFATSGTFQYIDTRFGNKVFYRLGTSDRMGAEKGVEGGELPASSSSSAASSTRAGQ